MGSCSGVSSTLIPTPSTTAPGPVRRGPVDPAEVTAARAPVETGPSGMADEPGATDRAAVADEAGETAAARIPLIFFAGPSAWVT